MAQILESKEAQALAGQGLDLSHFSPIKFNSSVGKHLGYTLAQVMFVWQYEAFKGNQKAFALVMACGVESLERRFDTAFGILRTEEERNERFQIRFDGILSRHFWTDSISEYIKTHPDLSENYKRWVFHNVSDTVNLALFGLTAKKVREHYQLENGMSVREMLNSRTLKLIDTIENAAATRVLETDSEPKQAIKDVIHLLGIEPSQDRL